MSLKRDAFYASEQGFFSNASVKRFGTVPIVIIRTGNEYVTKTSLKRL